MSRLLMQNLRASFQRLRRNPMRYLSIPVTAAGVGLVTNYIGVSMLFYPIHYTGCSLKRWPEQPFGIFGWQGVVPCKRFAMCNIMVDVTLNKLLKVSEVFEPLEAVRMADLLQESIRKVVMGGYLPLWTINYCLQRVSSEVIRKIESLVDLGDIVVTGMTTDPAVLGRFFQKVGANELDFLVRSGTYFGFLLGLVQMFLWMMFPVYWTLPISGAVVGFITNWIAIKMIFEPVVPHYIGPFKVHGMFLRRQKEVSAEFSEYLANNLLTSEQLWKEILRGAHAKEFENIIRKQLPFLTSGMVAAIMKSLEEQLISEPTCTPTTDVVPTDQEKEAVEAPVEIVATDATGQTVTIVLPPPVIEPVSAVVKAILEDKRHDEEVLDHLRERQGGDIHEGSQQQQSSRSLCNINSNSILNMKTAHPLHRYIDDTIALEALLIQRMDLLSPMEFERLLHPIFEEDELILILAGKQPTYYLYSNRRR